MLFIKDHGYKLTCLLWVLLLVKTFDGLPLNRTRRYSVRKLVVRHRQVTFVNIPFIVKNRSFDAIRYASRTSLDQDTTSTTTDNYKLTVLKDVRLRKKLVENNMDFKIDEDILRQVFGYVHFNATEKHTTTESTGLPKYNNVDITEYTTYNYIDATESTTYNNIDTTESTTYNHIDTTESTTYNHIDATEYTTYYDDDPIESTTYYDVNTTEYTTMYENLTDIGDRVGGGLAAQHAFITLVGG